MKTTKHILPVAALLASCSAGESGTHMNSSVILDEKGHVPDLVCPGVDGCEDATGPLQVGVAAVRITPVVETWEDADDNGQWNEGEVFQDENGNGEWDPVWMAGFGNGRAATGIHDDVWARVLLFSKGATRIGFVVLDVVGFYHDDVIKLRQAAAAAGLGLDHLIVTSNHNHETKDTQGLWGPSRLETGYDPEYIDFIIARSIVGLEEAATNARKAHMVVGTKDAAAFIADSREPKVIDPTIYAAKLIDENDVVFATFVVWGNHPEALGNRNTLITSDYPHYFREELERFYPGSTAVFAAGTLGGLMNPLGVRGCPDENGNGTCDNGSYEKAEWLGLGAAAVAIAALEEEPLMSDGAPALALRRKNAIIPATNAALALAFSLGLSSRTAFASDGRKLRQDEIDDVSLEDLDALRLRFQTEVNALTLGPVEYLTIPGELYPELWLVKEDGTSYVERPEGADFPDAPIDPPLQTLMPDSKLKVVINQANDAIGYIIPKAQFDVERPYAYDPDGQYGEGVSSGYETAPALADAVLKMYALTPN